MGVERRFGHESTGGPRAACLVSGRDEGYKACFKLSLSAWEEVVRIGKMSDSVMADGLIECCPDEWQTVVNGVCKIHLSGSAGQRSCSSVSVCGFIGAVCRKPGHSFPVGGKASRPCFSRSMVRVSVKAMLMPLPTLFPVRDEFVSLAFPAFEDQGVHIYRTCRTVRIELHTLRPSARLARYGLGPCSCQVDFFGLAAYRCGRQHQDKKFFHRDVVLCLFALVVRSGTAVVVRITLSGAKLPNISIGSTDRTGFRSEGLLIL